MPQQSRMAVSWHRPVPQWGEVDDADGVKRGPYYNKLGDCTGCWECLNQFRNPGMQVAKDKYQYRTAFSTAKAREITTAYAESIQTSLVYLHTKLESHGNAIINRWKKKSREERRIILLEAFPEITEEPWFLIRACYDYCCWHETIPFREAFLLPWLNLEALQNDPLKLFALLNARTKYPPEEWVIFDKEQMDLAWNEDRVAVDYAQCCVILYGPNYGVVCPWDTEQVHSIDTCAFPRARLILEAKATLMEFLSKSVKILITNLTGTSSSKWDEMARKNFRSSIGNEAWSVLGNQAFFGPMFDFDRLLNIARAQRAECTDTLWLLQTDIIFFQHHLVQITEGCLPDRSGTVDHKIAERRARSIYQVPKTQWNLWHAIVNELEFAKPQYDKFSTKIKLGQRPPFEFDFTMACLLLQIVLVVEQRVAALQDILPRMAAFQNYYTRKFDKDGNSYTALANHRCKDFFHKDPLFWCLHNLYHDFEKDRLADPAMLFGFLDDWLARSTKNESSRLPPALLNQLSSLAATHEIVAAVRQFRPGHACNVGTEEAIQKCGDRIAWHMATEDDAVGDLKTSQEDQMKLAKYLRAVESTPFPKGRRNATWLECADVVREHSRDNWAQARKMHKFMFSQPGFHRYTESDKKEWVNLLSFDSAPGHIASLKAEREAILSRTALHSASSTPVITIKDDRSLSQTSEAELKFLPAPPKEKRKSRPASSPTETDSYEISANLLESLTLNQVPMPVKLYVKAETIRVLSRMFPQSHEQYLAKPLDWKSFTIAMEDAGFPASQSGGSAVTFVKEGEGRIVFHKPHPVAKIDQMELQWWEKRMNKWFGWERETFVDAKGGGDS